jgi:SAM-dependent methyltransferase
LRLSPEIDMSDSEDRYQLRRRELSERYLVGKGVEIGALHNPLWTSTRASVRYVDRLDVPMLRTHYPELDGLSLVPVDIIDDGETLSSIADGRLDFIIANHMLEHTENPLGTLRNHLRKLRKGGVLYYAVPDKRYTFDVDRPMTPFEHLARDDREGAAVSRMDHFVEWARLVGKFDPDALDARVEDLLKINYSIHFHVWDYAHFGSFLGEATRYLGHAFSVEYYEQNGGEMIAILRKTSAGKIRLARWLARRLGVEDDLFGRP